MVVHVGRSQERSRPSVSGFLFPPPLSAKGFYLFTSFAAFSTPLPFASFIVPGEPFQHYLKPQGYYNTQEWGLTSLQLGRQQEMPGPSWGHRKVGWGEVRKGLGELRAPEKMRLRKAARCSGEPALLLRLCSSVLRALGQGTIFLGLPWFICVLIQRLQPCVSKGSVYLGLGPDTCSFIKFPL